MNHEPARRQSGWDHPRLGGASILVVDDEPLVRRVVARLLVSAGGYVREAANCDQAITIAAAESVDLLLTDMDMPGRDGTAVARAVTMLRPSVVVVFMSGRPKETHIALQRLTAKDLLIEKPFTFTTLVGMLEAALTSGFANPAL